MPVKLYEELQAPEKDFIEHFVKEKQTLTNDWIREALRPRKSFNVEFFSPFEMELMASLAKKHFSNSAEKMSEQSHFEAGLWHQVWEVEGNKQALIPYEYIFARTAGKEDMKMLEYAQEIAAFEHYYT